jgi:hypothetical protein
MVLTQPVIMGPKADQRRRTTIYQYNLTFITLVDFLVEGGAG